MIIKKICNHINIFVLVFTQIFFNSLIYAETKALWAKRASVEFEDFIETSSDAENNEHLCSHTPDGQIFYSINGHKIWWNKNADPEKKEPAALISFSAGAVQKCDIAYTALSILPNVFIKGTLWGILAPDHAKKPKEKFLYTFVPSATGYYWEKDETMPYLAEYVSAANDGTVLVLTSDGPYLKVDNNPWKKLACSTKLTFVAAGNKNILYALTKKQTVLTWKNNTWELLESGKQKNNIRHIAAKNDGTLYCVDNHGKAFYYSEKNGWIALADIKNAQRISVSPKKIFCWTSQPYGNAALKNQKDLLGKTAEIISGGGIAILGTGTSAIAAIGAGSLIAGTAIAVPLTYTKAFVEKTKKSARAMTKVANSMEDMVDDMDMPRFSDVDSLIAVYQSEAKAKKIANIAQTAYKMSGKGLVPALGLTALGIATLQSIPVFILSTAAASLLFGGSSIIILMILSRPHKNEIYEYTFVTNTLDLELSKKYNFIKEGE